MRYPWYLNSDCCDAFWSGQREAQPGYCCINEKGLIFTHFLVGKMKFHSSFKLGFALFCFCTFRNKGNKIYSAMGYPGKNQSQSKKTLKISPILLSGHWQGMAGSPCQESSQHLTHRSRGIGVPVQDKKRSRKWTSGDFYCLNIKNKALSSPLQFAISNCSSCTFFSDQCLANAFKALNCSGETLHPFMLFFLLSTPSFAVISFCHLFFLICAGFPI